MGRSILSTYAFAVLAPLATAAVARHSSQVVSVPYEYTYLLPTPFNGNSNYTFVNGTSTSSAEVNALLQKAKQAPIISYDQKFLDIVGPTPEVKLVAERGPGDDRFYEMGVWVPERNSVWFTSSVSSGVFPPTMYELDLGSNAVSVVQTKSNITNPNGNPTAGGYYYQGKVYIATYPNNQSYPGGVVSVDVNTLEVETVTNSYFGLRYNGVDDIAWASRNGCSYMYYTDLDFAYLGYDNLPPLQLPAAVYRWDPQEKVVLPVISRNEINPNVSEISCDSCASQMLIEMLRQGVRVSPDMKTLYATDSTGTFAGAGPYSPASGPSDVLWLGPYVYAWDLNEQMLPVNRRVFSQARQGIADGIHIDDAGNVWTGEYEGVVVRNPAGKTIGVFNSQFYQADKDAGTQLPVANFALAGDTLVFLSTTRLWTVKLAKEVVSRDSPIVN